LRLSDGVGWPDPPAVGDVTEELLTLMGRGHPDAAPLLLKLPCAALLLAASTTDAGMDPVQVALLPAAAAAAAAGGCWLSPETQAMPAW